MYEDEYGGVDADDHVDDDVNEDAYVNEYEYVDDDVNVYAQVKRVQNPGPRIYNQFTLLTSPWGSYNRIPFLGR